MEIIPKFPHNEPTMWGKPITQLINLELLQAYEFCLLSEANREAAKETLLKRNIKLPAINNPNYDNHKTAILNEISKRKLKI